MSAGFSLEPADEELPQPPGPLPRRVVVAVAVGVAALVAIVVAVRSGDRHPTAAPSSPAATSAPHTTGAGRPPIAVVRAASGVLVPGTSAFTTAAGRDYATAVELVNDTAQAVRIAFPIVTTSEFGIARFAAGIYPGNTEVGLARHGTPLRRIGAHQHVLLIAWFRVVCSPHPARPTGGVTTAVRLVGHPGTARFELAGPAVYRDACPSPRH